ncbi:MAG: HAMP domain-containing histidine kinase, partial [Bdellovibrionaceae bacterium]|nr:HAMP domain-containing histidine kinase [Pseudobdellovibrionaceae bacterium]
SIKNQFLLFSIGFLIILVAVMMIVQDPFGKKLAVGGFKVQNYREGEQLSKINSSSKDSSELKGTGPTQELKEESDKAKLEGYMRVASALGHELRAPIIKSLNLTTTFLAESTVNNENDEVKKIQSEMRSAKDTIDKLLIFAGDKPTEKIEAKVDTAILRALKNLETLLHLKSVRVVKDMTDTRNLSIDVNKVATVVENIIKNSIQAMERKIGKQINLKSYQNEKNVIIEITDNGDGIDTGNLNKIFEPFYTTLSFNKNVGLGLSIAQGIISEHDGKIKVESEKGKGTKVVIELPLVVSQTSTLGDTNKPDSSEVSNLNLRTLNIPKLSEDDFKLSEELENEDSDFLKDENNQNKSVEVGKNSKDAEAAQRSTTTTDKSDLKKTEVVNQGAKSSANINEEVNSMDPSKKLPTAPDLDVNIDELFEMNETPVVANVVVPLKPVIVNENKVELLQPPKKNAKVPDKKDSDDFQVVIRKPKGRG